MKKFIDEIKNKVLIYDGSKGYLLQKLGMGGGECSELWNVEHREEVKDIYRAYKNAGSDIIQTNTFPGNRIYLDKYSLGDRTYELNYEGARLAREVMGDDGYVAASIGPTGKLLEPFGDLTFDHACEVFGEQVKALVDGGVDIINFETFTDIAEMRAALLAAREVTNLPVICSMAFESNGKTLMGTDPYIAVVILKSLGADMIGTNCSFGPENMLEIVGKMSQAGDVYLSVKPNAGLPEIINDEIIYGESVEKFAAITMEYVKCGARLVGGCCGTTPEFIRAIREKITRADVPSIINKSEKLITSGTKLLNISSLQGANTGHINTETDNKLSNEFKKGSLEYITDKSMEIAYEGYDVVCINVDSISEDKHLLSKVVSIAQSYIKEPLIIETRECEALAEALRLYNGIAGVVADSNSKDYEKLIEVINKFGSTLIDKSLLG